MDGTYQFTYYEEDLFLHDADACHSLCRLCSKPDRQTWCTVLNDDDGEGIAVALTFAKNGSCELVIAAQQEMKEDGVPITLVAGVTVPGRYHRDGKDLNTQFNQGKAKVDVDYEIKGMDAKTKALMDKQIRSDLNSFKNEFRTVMLDGIPKMDNLRIVSLDAKRLVVKNDDDQEIPFFAE